MLTAMHTHTHTYIYILYSCFVEKHLSFLLQGACVRLLSFGAESFVFQVAIQKFKDQDI